MATDTEQIFTQDVVLDLYSLGYNDTQFDSKPFTCLNNLLTLNIIFCSSDNYGRGFIACEIIAVKNLIEGKPHLIEGEENKLLKITVTAMHNNSKVKIFEKVNNVDLTQFLKEDDVLLFEWNMQRPGKILVNIKVEAPKRVLAMSSYFPTPEKSVHRSISSLFNSRKFSDFTIEVQGVKFEVHKNILAMGSEVFEVMLNTDMKEAQENKLIIEDIAPEVFKELLQYIYTGEVSSLEKVTLELAQAADKYAMDELVNICHRYVQERMSRGHVMSILKYGLFKDAPKIANIAVKFVVEKKSQFSPEDIQALCENAAFAILLLNFKHSSSGSN